MQGYHFQQVSGDTGRAVLGSFKGRVTGAGVTGAYNFAIAGKIPATLRLHGMTEFDAKNRMEGNSVFLDFYAAVGEAAARRGAGGTLR